MSRFSPVFRNYLKGCGNKEVDLALFDIISVGPGIMSNGTIVGTLVVQESTYNDNALFQLNNDEKVSYFEKKELDKRAIQFKKRIQEEAFAREIDPNKEIKIYDV